MKLFSRNIPIREVPVRVLDAVSILARTWIFKKPLSVWLSYLCSKTPNCGFINFRDGDTAWMSQNPHDIITLMVIFCKKEYGEIQPGSLVVDIGANIGMFSLFALRSRASEVIAYEPNPESYNVLTKNLSQFTNNSEIRIFQLAVSGKAGENVYIPIDSSPYNVISRTQSGNEPKNCVPVKTTDLDEIVACLNGRRIDYLKVDCEGSEWDIFSKCTSKTLEQIQRIRMEFHPQKGIGNSQMIARLQSNGFRLVHSKNLIMWFDRSQQQRGDQGMVSQVEC